MAEGERELVKFEIIDGIGIITIDNPPVNALSPGVPDGIVAAVDRGNADPSVKAMALIGQMIKSQATILAYIDVFHVCAIVAALMTPLVLVLVRRINIRASSAAAIGH